MNVQLPNGKTEYIAFKPLIRAFGQKHLGIRGGGVLDGRGTAWWKKLGHATRPVFIHFFGCEDILVESIRIQNSPMFNLQIVDSSDIIVRKIHINNPPTGGGKNTDGLNLYSVRHVHIHDVKITTGDDCIALKALGIGNAAIPTENVLIEYSQMLGGHGGLSIGSEITGGARNVTIRNCYFSNTIRGLQIKTNRIRGGTIEKITAHNITMHKIQREAIAITTYYSFKKKDERLLPVNETTPFIRNIEYDEIRGDCRRGSILIDGLPESNVENVKISNMDVKAGGAIALNNTKNVFINGKKWS
nr:unnamed protein product [Callosobruchus chinensis]